MSFATFSGFAGPLLNTPSQGFNQAMGGFKNYGGNKDALGMAFYPMLFDGLKHSFGQAGMDPYGDSVRQLAPKMSQAEQFRHQMQEQEDLQREKDAWQAKKRAEWESQRAAGRPAAEDWIKTQTPDNQRLYRLMWNLR